MKTMQSRIVLGVAALCMWAAVAQAQHPNWDVLNVNFPHRVMVNDMVLEPGTYTFEEHSSPSKQWMFKVYNADGKFLTTTNQGHSVQYKSPVAVENPADRSFMVLKALGNGTYYISQVFVEGDLIGYEFNPTNRMKSVMREMNMGEDIRVRVNPERRKKL